VPRLHVTRVRLVVDGGARAVVLAHTVDALGRAAPDVLSERLLGESSLAEPLGAELEADVVLLLAREQLLRKVVGLGHERPVIAVERPLA
jgi:hypothetical protein